MQSLYIEDLHPGESFDSGERPITLEMFDQHAALSWDTNPVHLDDVVAAESKYGKRFAQGALIFSVATGLSWQLGLVCDSIELFSEVSKLKFKKPVFSGDTLRLRITILEARTTLVCKFGFGRATFSVNVLNQDNDVVQEGTWELLIKSRRAATAA